MNEIEINWNVDGYGYNLPTSRVVLSLILWPNMVYNFKSNSQ